MLNLNTHTQEIADNTIAINNVVIGKLTDTDAQKILDIVRAMVSQTSTQAHTQVATPVAQPVVEDTPKVYESAEDFDDIAWTRKDNTVVYTTKAGKYLHNKDVRNVLNARLKAAGAVWSADNKVWVFTKGEKRDIKGATSFVETASTVVTAEERENVRTKWAEKKAKKSAK